MLRQLVIEYRFVAGAVVLTAPLLVKPQRLLIRALQTRAPFPRGKHSYNLSAVEDTLRCFRERDDLGCQ